MFHMIQMCPTTSAPRDAFTIGAAILGFLGAGEIAATVIIGTLTVGSLVGTVAIGACIGPVAGLRQ